MSVLKKSSKIHYLFLIAIFSIFVIAWSMLYAQPDIGDEEEKTPSSTTEETKPTSETKTTEETKTETTPPADAYKNTAEYKEYKTGKSLHARLSRITGMINDEFGYRITFIGGYFMHFLYLCALAGFFILIERAIVLIIASYSTKKFVSSKYAEIQKVIKDKGAEGVPIALEECQKSSSPVAGILEAGLLKYNKGISEVEKAIDYEGAVEMSTLEKNLGLLATLVSVAPMLGFLGTVSGMINAFDKIAAYGRIEPTLVATGIKEALITTAAGLIIAIPLQAGHSFFISWIDSLVMEMEESSYALVETLVEATLKDQAQG